MNVFNYFYSFILVFFLFQNNHSFAQVTIDASALPIFWELVDTLEADKTPSKTLWHKFEDHPAYVQIQKSGNRVTYLKKVLPIVFKPSNAAKYQSIINGPENLYQYFAKHLHSIKVERKPLEEYLETNDFNSYAMAYMKSLSYLPKDINEEDVNLTVYLALFEDNGFGGKVITMDLLHLLRGSTKENEDFFAHEFHHALRGQSTENLLFAPDSSEYYPIIQALNKIPLEGVASILDKKKYFDAEYFNDTLQMSDNQKETIIEFKDLWSKAPDYLKEIDLILKSDQEIKVKGNHIFQQLPWSGHVIGFYMANAIEKEFGRDKLVEAQYSCMQFFFLYQEAARLNENLYQFSKDAISFLETLH